MRPRRLMPVLLALGLLWFLPATNAGGLPVDAAKQVKDFEAEAEAIQKKADAEIAAKRAKLIAELEKLAREYAKTGEADAAIAIRAQIAKLKATVEKTKNILVNGSFEEGPVPVGDGFVMLDKGSTAIKGWTVTQGTLDYVDSAYWQSADGKRSLDMNGVEAGGIAQTFKSKKGQKYRVTFSMAGNPNGGPAEKKLRVSAAGKNMEFTFDGSGKSRPDMGWVSKSWDFVANADETTLEFLSLIEGDAGAALDNVVVVPVED
jgi:choice-of-anchor C domain-containing protein